MVASPAAFYGLPDAAAVAAPPTAAPSATPANTPQSLGAVRSGLHQDPVFVLVAIVFVAFLLARLAEHGLSLGFKISAK